MGLFDLFFGANRSKGDDPEEEIKRNKARGNLFAGGEGNVDHNQERETNNPRAMKIADRLSGGLDEVERRTKDMQLDERRMDKISGKLSRAIEKVGDAKNLHDMHDRQVVLRRKMRGSYAKIEQEHEKRIEELKRKGTTERRIREEEFKMKKTREEMSSMYRRAGGSGMLK